jgi:hypothetical protein
MIQVHWMAATMVVAIGALLTVLLTYVVAAVGRSTGHRIDAGGREDGALTRELSGDEAARHRPAA